MATRIRLSRTGLADAARDALRWCPACGGKGSHERRDYDERIGLVVPMGTADCQTCARLRRALPPAATPPQQSSHDAEHVEQLLADCLDHGRFADDGIEGADVITRVRTFEHDGILTDDRGLVLTLDDGSEYQVTIVRSR